MGTQRYWFLRLSIHTPDTCVTLLLNASIRRSLTRPMARRLSHNSSLTVSLHHKLTLCRVHYLPLMGHSTVKVYNESVLFGCVSCLPMLLWNKWSEDKFIDFNPRLTLYTQTNTHTRTSSLSPDSHWTNTNKTHETKAAVGRYLPNMFTMPYHSTYKRKVLFKMKIFFFVFVCVSLPITALNLSTHCFSSLSLLIYPSHLSRAL